MWTIDGIPLNGSSGMALASAELGTGMADRAVVTSVQSWGTSQLALGSWVTLAQDGQAILHGQVVGAEPYAQGGGAQGLRYEIVNAWGVLETVVYKQRFSYATSFAARVTRWRSKVWLGVAENGDRLDTRETILRICDYAATMAGVPMDVSAFGWGTMVPVTQAVDTTCAALILQILRWHPNVVPYWRYSFGGATLHLRQLGSLDGVSLVVSNASLGAAQPISAEVRPRPDRVPPCVIVKYERANEFTDPDSGTVQLIEMHEEKAGGGSEHAPGAMCYTIELPGIRSQAIVQPVRTRSIPGEFGEGVEDEEGGPVFDMKKAVKWCQCHIPAIRGLDPEAMELVEHLRAFDDSTAEAEADDDEGGGGDDEEDDEEDVPPLPPRGTPQNFVNDEPVEEEGEGPEEYPEDYPRELVEGTLQEWMVGVKSRPMCSRVVLKWKGSEEADEDEDQLEQAKLFFGADLEGERMGYIRYVATDATTRRYRGTGSYVQPEAWPSGLASALYANLSTLRYEGSVTVRRDDALLTVLPGMMLTLTGKTGSGPVTRVSIEGGVMRTSISFGWPGHLSAQDLFELQRASRVNEVHASYDERRMRKAVPGGGANTVEGTLRSVRTDVQMDSPKQINGHVWRMRIITEDDTTRLEVAEPGWFNGVYPRLEGGGRINDVPAPTVEVSDTGTVQVWLRVKVQHQVEKGYVYATSISDDEGSEADGGRAVYLEVGDSIPESGNTEGSESWDEEAEDVERTGTVEAEYCVPLATIVDGRIQPQPVRNSIAARWCPSGMLDAKATMVLGGV